MSKRKYPEVKGWWVYSIKVPSINKYYIGVSKQKCCYKRWQKAFYKEKSLKPYLSEWDSMIKTVLVDNLTKEEAYQYEGKIIDALSMNNLCINERRSGLIKVSDVNAYMREYREDNKEQYNEYHKQYYERNKEKINQQKRQRRLKKKLEKQQNQ